jgi:hypothetical protein
MRTTVITIEIAELARQLMNKPGFIASISVDGKIDRAKLRAAVAQEQELYGHAVTAKDNGMRPRRGKGGGPKGRQVSPSPWAREHPKWDPK